MRKKIISFLFPLSNHIRSISRIYNNFDMDWSGRMDLWNATWYW